MSIILRTWAILLVAIKRLFSQRWLAVANIVGLTATVALAVCIPEYADAIYYRILQDKLTQSQQGSENTFVFMFRYIGSWAGPINWEDAEEVDQYLTTNGPSEIGLPIILQTRYFKTDRFELYPYDAAVYGGQGNFLDYVNFAFAADFENHINIIEGSFPKIAEATPDSMVEVLISQEIAEQLGLQVGETYQAYTSYKNKQGSLVTLQVPVRIAGVWAIKDKEDPYWFYSVSAFREILFVPESTFVNRISPYLDNEVNLGLWYYIMDSTSVHAEDVDSIIIRTTKVENKANALLASTSLSVSPLPELQIYRSAVGPLTILLYAFSVPILGLIFVFLFLVVGLSVMRQRNEIAILRSRGATPLQIIGISALEGLILGVIGLAFGLALGVGFTYLIGKSRSFLDFSLQSELRLDITLTTFRVGLVVIALAVLAQIIPSLGAARHTIVTYKQERARMLQKPFWQRAYLDFLLLIPVIYGTYLLRQQGSIVFPTEKGTVFNTPLQNPLFFLVPALGVFALILIILRILPVLMGIIAWITSRTNLVGILMASRHLSRTPGYYSTPLILLILTLSLSTYTASLAKTLDQNLKDKTYYRIGADIGLSKQGESKEDSFSMLFSSGESQQEPKKPEESLEPRWVFLPISDYTGVEGVQAAARVGTFNANTQLSGRYQTGKFVGIDRVDFTQVAFWRDDFAPASLGALMNNLALTSNGVLVPRDFLATHLLRIGDTIRITVYTYTSESIDLDFLIVGAFDLFPGWYPSEMGPLFIGNLEYIFEEAGGIYPYSVWLKTEPNADHEAIIDTLGEMGASVIFWAAPQNDILEEQQKPERQGLFGVLSVGFIASAVLTVLGFLFYAFFSFRRRFIELGLLRAVGLSARQMTSFLAWELAFLIFTGLGVGTGLGILASKIYIPFLQIGANAIDQIPPFIVLIAWNDIFRIYILFGLLFLAGLGILAALLMRMKIFQAIKLGEVA